ncbi:hypothetical protein [Parapedobacter soli]|uniref:hypothetical protein n=1 Tax=Parapedobacter soli TaxID=416955 RepID=UPI0021C94839|nr:hypothetical protein [Parapedobacter soli]
MVVRSRFFAELLYFFRRKMHPLGDLRQFTLRTGTGTLARQLVPTFEEAMLEVEDIGLAFRTARHVSVVAVNPQLPEPRIVGLVVVQEATRT